MNRDQLLRRLDDGWQALLQSFQGLPDSAMTEPGVTGAWSVKDLLGHVTTWEEENLKLLKGLLEGRRPPRYGDVDAFNAREAEKKRGLSLDEIRKQLFETHGRLVSFLEGVPEDRIATDTPFRRRLRIDSHRHYREHSSEIAAWRRSRGV